MASAGPSWTSATCLRNTGRWSLTLDDEVLDRLGRAQELARLKPNRLVRLHQFAAQERGVRPLQGPLNVAQGHVMPGHSPGRKVDRDLPGPAPDHVRPSGVLHRLQANLQLLRHPPQLVVAVGRTEQGQVDDGHVVDLDGLDDPARDARRHLVDVGLNLVVQLDPASLQVLAHVEANGHDGLARHARRVDVFHAGDLVEQLLQPGRDLPLHFRRLGPGHGDHHIGHRHDDLRVLLARRDQQRRRPGDQTHDDQQDRQIALEKRLDDPRHPVMAAPAFTRWTASRAQLLCLVCPCNSFSIFDVRLLIFDSGSRGADPLQSKITHQTSKIHNDPLGRLEAAEHFDQIVVRPAESDEPPVGNALVIEDIHELKLPDLADRPCRNHQRLIRARRDRQACRIAR